MELKPCPFCGSKPRYYYEDPFVACSNSKCPAYEFVGTPEEWNTRTDGWISVEERLPDTYDDVLVIEHGQYEIGWYNGAWQGCYGPNVTHWMPLPQPPDTGEENQNDGT